MIVFASPSRTARRPRRFPSLASVVRALGSARVSEHPFVDSSGPVPAGCDPSHETAPRTAGDRGQIGPFVRLG